ncbi:MAG: ATP-binding protein [Planctomycetota bacterium]
MTATASPAAETSTASSGVLAPDDLAEVIRAYSDVAERLQASHEALSDEVVRLQQELAAKNVQLERSKRLSALGEMAAGIAHEIRNPLAAIQLYAEMVTEDLAEAACGLASEDDAQLGFAADNTRKIADAVRGLSAIVNDVLSFARRIEPGVQPLDARSTLQRVVDAHRPEIEKHGVAVSIEVQSDIIYADADMLHQALLNLVRNAVDAMAEQGGGQLSLAVEAEKITLSDTGPGLPKEVIDRIFNPFFTTRSTGTGLGLAIVHRIVDAHGGTIAVRNHPRHGGAVFTLELPAPQAARGLAPSSESLEPAA